MLGRETALATNRLDELMKTMAVAQKKRWPRRWIAATVLVAIALGGVLATVNRPKPLLAGVDSGPPQSDDVWGQIYHAKMVDTEEAWRAVIDYFPDAGEYYHDLARQGLVYYYLSRPQEVRKAIRPLEELAASSQSSLQAFGIAGLVVAHAQMGEVDRANQANQRLSSEMRTVLEEQAPRMATLLGETLQKLGD
jgi:hypothetical protein